MQQVSDPFEILGVSVDATDAEVKAAYRAKAKVSHPDVDRSVGAIDRFQSIQRAYDLLSDPIKREAARTAKRRFAPVQPVDLRGEFGSFFDNIDQNGRGRPLRAEAAARTAPLQPINVNLEVTLEEAFKGGEFVAGGKDDCSSCHGLRFVSVPRRACPHCAGRGITRAVRGIVTTEIDCPTCHATGWVETEPCGLCAGDVPRRVTVRLPAGVKDGYEVTVADDSAVRGWGGQPDAVVRVSVLPHDRFSRSGEHLKTVLRVPLWAAALGEVVELVGVDLQPLRLRLSPGTQSGATSLLKGAGMPAYSGRGDLEVQIEVEIPSATTPELRALFETLKQQDPVAR